MKTTIAEHIIKRLKELGCHHVFGIPGTSCAAFFNKVEELSNIDYVVTANELEAGYIADGYGRQNNIGVVCVSYGVGTLSLANATASALTEKVPMLILNGGPTEKDLRIERDMDVLFAHSTGRLHTDYQVFKHITVGAKIIKDLSNAQKDIDDLLETAMREYGPVYIEIPQNKWLEEINSVETPLCLECKSSESQLDLLFKEIKKQLQEEKDAVLLVGSEISRLQKTKQIVDFIEKNQIPFATTLLSKSIISEHHPLFIGVYDSDLAPKDVRDRVENADLLFSLGSIFGIDHRFMVERQYNKMIDVSYGKARIGKEKFPDISLCSFIERLSEISISTNKPLKKTIYREKRDLLIKMCSFEKSEEKLGHEEIFDSVDSYLKKSSSNLMVVVDTCLASYPGADLEMPHTNMYLANPIWLSIGQGTPAAIGAYFASKKRPLIITGDGGFQMIAQTFSTLVKYQIPAIIVVIDNGLYAIEQFLLDGSYFLKPNQVPIKFNLLHRWKYEEFPIIFNGGDGFRVKSKKTFIEALQKAETITNYPVIIAAEIPSNDLPSENRQFLENNH